MAFDGAIRPGQLQRSLDSPLVLVDTLGETHERRQIACRRGCQPSLQGWQIPLGNDAVEPLQQPLEVGELWVVAEQLLEHPTFILVELFGRTQTQPPRVEAPRARAAGSGGRG